MSSPLDRFLAALHEKGLSPASSGRGWTCRCPAHDDRTPSLSIHTGDDGRLLVHCHAGCTAEAICESLGLSTARLFAPENGVHPPRAQPPARTFPTARDAVAELERRHGPRSVVWTYMDAAGIPVGLIIRWDLPNRRKEIRPVSRCGTAWRIGAMPSPRPLYRLPELLAADPQARVYVCEGEKAAEAARSLGLVATTSPHGSKSAAKADWSPLAGRNVVIVPDRDEAGETYARDVTLLARKAKARSVRIVHLDDRWPALPPGGDLADLVNAQDEASLAKLRAEVESLADTAESVEGEEEPVLGGAPLIVRLADVEPEPVRWLWPGRIALGKVTLIAGDPGLGKSFLTLDVAARVSRGRAWPDHRHDEAASGGVVLLSAEDDVADTIRPRLDAAGADPSRIIALQAIRQRGEHGQELARLFDLSRDLRSLERAIGMLEDCRLVVIDPITAYLGGTDSHKNGEVRGLLAPLSALAAEQAVAIVMVTHLNKNAGGQAIYRTMGSLAFAAAARAVWSVTRDPQDSERRLLLPIKNNIGSDKAGLAYRIAAPPGQSHPSLVWEDAPVMLTADDVFSPSSHESTAFDEAREWLRDVLSQGATPVAEIRVAAQRDGIAWRTAERAKQSLGVQATREGYANDGRWVWVLPGAMPSPPADRQRPPLAA